MGCNERGRCRSWGCGAGAPRVQAGAAAQGPQAGRQPCATARSSLAGHLLPLAAHCPRPRPTPLRGIPSPVLLPQVCSSTSAWESRSWSAAACPTWLCGPTASLTVGGGARGGGARSASSGVSWLGGCAPACGRSTSPCAALFRCTVACKAPHEAAAPAAAVPAGGWRAAMAWRRNSVVLQACGLDCCRTLHLL